jgi:uncharacterized protein with FMN-binding domain
MSTFLVRRTVAGGPSSGPDHKTIGSAATRINAREIMKRKAREIADGWGKGAEVHAQDGKRDYVQVTVDGHPFTTLEVVRRN